MSLGGRSLPDFLWNKLAQPRIHLDVGEIDWLSYTLEILAINYNIDVPLREAPLFECIVKLFLLIHEWALYSRIRL